MTNSTQLICSSAASTIDSYEINHDIDKKIEITPRIRKTGYGTGFRVKISRIDEAMVLLL